MSKLDLMKTMETNNEKEEKVSFHCHHLKDFLEKFIGTMKICLFMKQNRFLLGIN